MWGNEGNGESLFGKHFSNGYYGQESLMDAKISGWNFDEK